MLSLYFVCVAAIFAPLTRRDTLHRKSCRGDTAAGGGAHGAEAACVRFLHTHRRIAYRLSENMPASGSGAPIFANKCCMPGRCMLCKIYICAYENVCMVIAGKRSDLRHFFRFCCVFVKRMIEFVKKLYFFVFLFIKKLTKHKGRGILYLTEIMTAFCVYADL